jgi:aminoglycoside phosphotransferase family enzyme/predicted kinase
MPDQARDSAALVAWLSDPANHPDRPRAVEVVETHISWVFLTRRYAYKLKKPVRFDFLDFQSPEARRAACWEELRLNRRLARSTYLDVVPITRDADGRLHWGRKSGSGTRQSSGGPGGAAGSPAISATEEGPAVDWLDKMWRLPEKRRLDKLVERNEAAPGDAVRICRALSKFYEQAPPLAVRPDDYRASLERHIGDNRSVLLDWADAEDALLVERVHRDLLTLLRLAPDLLDERVRAGRVVDGHGDLRPEHIYLMPEPVIVDCIEFNADFRRVDVADELCFLAMELAAAGADEMGERMLTGCLAALDDRPDTRLLTFYQSYRACVRAKVAALRSRQLAGAARLEATEKSRAYLSIADQSRAAGEGPLLLAVGGLMGTGKSTLARALAESLGLERLATDDIRLELFGASNRPQGFEQGGYSPERRAQVYEEMLRRAEARLARGVSVALDATFSTAATREAVRKLAERRKARFLPIICQCPAEVARERIAARRAAGGDASEARPELLDAQRRAFEPPDAAALPLDTTRDLSSQQEAVFRRLRVGVEGVKIR